MHPLQNGSQVTERPADKPVSGLPGYFTESGENNVPSYPGADWFNDNIDEFLNSLSVFGISFEHGRTDHLSRIFSGILSSLNSRKTVSDFGIVGDGQQVETDKFTLALQSCDNGSLDLLGKHIVIEPISVDLNSIRLYSSVPNAKIEISGVGNYEFGLKINTLSVFSSVFYDDFLVDGSNLCAKPFFTQNSVSGEVYRSNNVSVINALQTVDTGLACGHYLLGGFNYVEINHPKADNITSSGGSLVSSGIRCEQNSQSVSKKIIINFPGISNVKPGNDGDGIVLLQSFPYVHLGEYEVNFGTFLNCHKRAIKTQCWKTVVRIPKITRTEPHLVFGGNVDIDIQNGNGEIIYPIYDFSSHLTAPLNGLFSLMPERGASQDENGRSTTVFGGICTVRSDDVVPGPFCSISTFQQDKVKRPSVSNFIVKGSFKSVCSIRPEAGSEFNEVKVYEPKFVGCVFDKITDSFFILDRAGSGYAYTHDASVIDCKVLSGRIDLDSSVTTNVGISYDYIDPSNYNIGELTTTRTVSSIFNVADDQEYTKTINAPVRSGVEITVTYNSSAGNSYHALRKSILSLGDQNGEFLETVIANVDSAFGSWGFSITSEVVDGEWVITVHKPAGVSSTGGSVQIIASSASVIY